MPEPRFTNEQIRHQAQEDALAYLLASIVYFKKQGRSPQEFIAVVGETLVPLWKKLKGHEAQVVMDALALHMVSLGAKLVAAEGDDDLAFATFARVPSSDLLKIFGLSKDEADVIWDIFKPIATFLNLKYTWSREQDEVTLKLSRPGLSQV
ncbi:MAG TPA: hypothetical protein VF043_38410 [Ktedonobacteraceae bacterium]